MSAASSEEIAGTMELDSISDRVWQIQACSAKTGEGLQEGMEWLVGNCKKGWTLSLTKIQGWATRILSL